MIIPRIKYKKKSQKNVIFTKDKDKLQKHAKN